MQVPPAMTAKTANERRLVLKRGGLNGLGQCEGVGSPSRGRLAFRDQAYRRAGGGLLARSRNR